MIEQSRAALGDLEDPASPFYSAAKLRAWLGIDQRALDALVRDGSILELTTGDGEVVYPVWQWRVDGTTIPRLGDVLALLLVASGDPWAIALWMTSPVDWGDEHALPAWKWLDDGHNSAPVIDQARADAARWAR